MLLILSYTLVLALLQAGMSVAVPLNRADLMNALESLSVDELQTLLRDVNQELAAQQQSNEPFQSCKYLPNDSKSGDYLIRNAAGVANRVYCDMNKRFLDGIPGWMRVAHVNSRESCPSGLQGEKDCRCMRNTTANGCSSVVFPSHGNKYSKVCGKVRAIQYNHPTGFRPYIQRNTVTLEESYVDGVSLTHGRAGERKHIWTFAAVHSDDDMQCSCSSSDKTPPFVGSDFFCETGSRAESRYDDDTFESDPLWDGEGCDSQKDCCLFNRPPWFCKELSQPTTDDIEMRLCLNTYPASTYGDVRIEAVDILVQ